MNVLSEYGKHTTSVILANQQIPLHLQKICTCIAKAQFVVTLATCSKSKPGCRNPAAKHCTSERDKTANHQNLPPKKKSHLVTCLASFYSHAENHDGRRKCLIVGEGDNTALDGPATHSGGVKRRAHGERDIPYPLPHDTTSEDKTNKTNNTPNT